MTRQPRHSSIADSIVNSKCSACKLYNFILTATHARIHTHAWRQIAISKNYANTRTQRPLTQNALLVRRASLMHPARVLQAAPGCAQAGDIHKKARRSGTSVQENLHPDEDGGKGEGVEGVLNTFRDGREGDELVPFLFPSSYVFIKIRNTHLVKRSISETCRILG